jgi:hypothetical protein
MFIVLIIVSVVVHSTPEALRLSKPNEQSFAPADARLRSIDETIVSATDDDDVVVSTHYLFGNAGC